MSFTIYDADLAPSTAEASLAGATLAFLPTSAVPVDKLAVLLAVWDNTDGTNADNTTFLSVADSKGNTWVRAGETQYSAGLALDGLIAAIFYSIITTQIETTDTVTITHSSALGVFKAATLAAFNRDTSKTVQVADKGYQRVAASTSYTVSVSGLASEEHLWVGENGQERTPSDLNGSDGDYTKFQQGGSDYWGAGSGTSAAIGGRGGYRITTGTSETYDRASLGSADRATILVAFREVSAQTIAIGQAVAVDVARSLSTLKTASIGQAVAANVAQPFSALKTQSIGQASEADQATLVVVVRTLQITKALEADQAAAVSKLKAAEIGRATETDIGRSISSLKTVALGRAIEADSARGITSPGRLGIALETEVARPLTTLKTVQVARATEIDSARLVTFPVHLELAIESDSAQALGVTKTRQVEQSTELDSAETITPRRTLAIGQAVESDSAQAVSVQKSLSIGQATELDIAGSLSAPQDIGQSQESDSAMPVVPTKTLQLGEALEADVAQAMVAAKVIPLLQALEADLAQALGTPLIVGPAIEVDGAGFIFRPRFYEGVSTTRNGSGKSTEATRDGVSTSVRGSGVSTYTGEE